MLARRRPRRRPRGCARRARLRRLNGATRSLRNRCGRPKPVTKLKRSAMSAAMSGSAVKSADVLVDRARSSRGSCRCRCGRSAGARRPRAGRRASSSRGSSCPGSRRRRARPPARATRAHSMLRRSSKRAFSSTTQTLCLPFSAASISAGASAESWLVRYTVVFSVDDVRVVARLPARTPRRSSRTSRTGAGRRCRAARSRRRGRRRSASRAGAACTGPTARTSGRAGRARRAAPTSARSSRPRTG